MKKLSLISLLLVGCGHTDEGEGSGILWDTWGITQNEARYRDTELLDVLELWHDNILEIGLTSPRGRLEPVTVYWVHSYTYKLVDGREVRGHTSNPNEITVAADGGEYPWNTSLMHELWHAYFWGPYDEEECPEGDGDHTGPEPECWTTDHELSIEITRADLNAAQGG